jgi:hypothetical protein
MQENWQDALWTIASKFLVHPVTGHIAQVTEGDLLQLPYNQSATEWYLPGEHRKVWTTELADNVRDARVAVIQRTFEEYLRIAQEKTGLLHSSNSATQIGAVDTTAAHFQTVRLITSGILDEGFEPRAFFRALSSLAERTGTWGQVRTTPALLKHEARPLTGYLEDIGALKHIRVDRHIELSTGGCDILKFSFRDKPISIVAGPAGGAIWIRGLKDIWLAMTALEGLPATAETVPTIRYRCSDDLPARLSNAMHSLRHQLALSFELAELSGGDLALLQPLIFTSATVSCAQDLQSENGNREAFEAACQAESTIACPSLPGRSGGNRSSANRGSCGPQ